MRRVVLLIGLVMVGLFLIVKPPFVGESGKGQWPGGVGRSGGGPADLHQSVGRNGFAERAIDHPGRGASYRGAASLRDGAEPRRKVAGDGQHRHLALLPFDHQRAGQQRACCAADSSRLPAEAFRRGALQRLHGARHRGGQPDGLCFRR